MWRAFALLGSTTACLAVALGAFGAHNLKNKLSVSTLATYATGFENHIMHSVGLIAVGIVSHGSAHPRPTMWVVIVLFAGILLFSGSLYVLSVTGVRWLGTITPLGGLCFLAGWLMLAGAVLKKPQP